MHWNNSNATKKLLQLLQLSNSVSFFLIIRSYSYWSKSRPRPSGTYGRRLRSDRPARLSPQAAQRSVRNPGGPPRFIRRIQGGGSVDLLSGTFPCIPTRRKSGTQPRDGSGRRCPATASRIPDTASPTQRNRNAHSVRKYPFRFHPLHPRYRNREAPQPAACEIRPSEHRESRNPSRRFDASGKSAPEPPAGYTRRHGFVFSAAPGERTHHFSKRPSPAISMIRWLLLPRKTSEGSRSASTYRPSTNVSIWRRHSRRTGCARHSSSV